MENIHNTDSLFNPTLTCRACGPVQPETKWKPMANNRRHLGAYCPKCNRWIKWVRQNQGDRLQFLNKNLDARKKH